VGRLLDPPVPTHDPAQVRHAADKILSQPRYQWNDGPGLLQRIGRWLSHLLSRIGSPFGLPTVPVWVGWLVLGLLVALIGFLIYRAASGGGLSRGGGAAARRRGSGVVVSSGEENVDWAAEVVRCEAEGRWREALRARFRVLVGELAAREVLGDLVGRTAGELVTDVRRQAPPAGPAFAAAAGVFEAAWYGHAPTGPADRDRFAALAADVLARVPPVPAGAR